MRKIAWHIQFLALGAAAFLLGACEVEQADERDSPEAEVQKEEAPNYEIETPDVDVKSDTDTVVVETPEVEVE